MQTLLLCLALSSEPLPIVAPPILPWGGAKGVRTVPYHLDKPSKASASSKAPKAPKGSKGKAPKASAPKAPKASAAHTTKVKATRAHLRPRAFSQVAHLRHFSN